MTIGILNTRNGIKFKIFTILSVLFSVTRASAHSNYTDEFNDMFYLQVALSIVVIVLVLGLMFYMLFKYRDTGEDDEFEEVEIKNVKWFELTWTSLALILVLFLFFASIGGVNNFIDANAQTPTEVIKVSARQYDWTFTIESHNVNFTASLPPSILLSNGTDLVRYPSSQVIANLTLLTQYEATKDGFMQIVQNPNTGKYYQALVLDVDKPYRYEVTSDDASVIHSFYVHELSFKADAIPGSVNVVTVTIEEPNIYWGACAELCGVGHYDMLFAIIGK